MRHSIQNKWLHRTLTWNAIHGKGLTKKMSATMPMLIEIIKTEDIEKLYKTYRDSQPDGMKQNRFYAKSLLDMTMEDLIWGENRSESKKILEDWLSNNITTNNFPAAANQWYWQSEKYPELVLLRQWFE